MYPVDTLATLQIQELFEVPANTTTEIGGERTSAPPKKVKIEWVNDSMCCVVFDREGTLNILSTEKRREG